jgi:hypothetical protein
VGGHQDLPSDGHEVEAMAVTDSNRFAGRRAASLLRTPTLSARQLCQPRGCRYADQPVLGSLRHVIDTSRYRLCGQTVPGPRHLLVSNGRLAAATAVAGRASSTGLHAGHARDHIAGDRGGPGLATAGNLGRRTSVFLMPNEQCWTWEKPGLGARTVTLQIAGRERVMMVGRGRS